MKPVLTPEQAGELDRATQASGVAAADLMDRAGRAVARAAADLTGGTYGRRATIVCGKGNNGGDGLVAGRYLARWGMAVTIVLLEPGSDLRDPAATHLRRLDEVGRVRVLPFSPATLERELRRSDVAIDAIFGTGFRGQPEDAWAEAIEGLAGPVPVVAVDIPSGVDGASGAADGAAVRATLTVAFGAPKLGTVLLPGAELAGALRVVDIGFADDAMRAEAFVVEPEDVRAALPVREVDTHKRASGVLVVVAGSREMPGAARLLARAGGRIGTGLVIVAVPSSVLAVASSGLTEPTFRALPETEAGSVAPEAVPVVLAAAERADAIAIGPGLSTEPATLGFVRELVRASPVPCVVDADGLTAFAGDVEGLADRAADAVLTPHAGEFARLVGTTSERLERDRVARVREVAAAAGCVTLLKGSRTLVAEPTGRLTINPTGGPVLATAGSGDVLTGMIGGLLARGVPAPEAARAAAFLHGLAGTLAGRERGTGTVAGDLVEAIPEAVARVGAA